MNHEFDPVGFGERIREGMAERGLDILSLQKAVAADTNGAKGSSYGSIWSYVKGSGPETEPRGEVVAAIGEHIDRLPDWLLYGKGPRSQREALIEERTAPARVERAVGAYFRGVDAGRERIEAELGITSGVYGPIVFGVLESLLITMLSSGKKSIDAYSEGEVAEAYYLLAWLLILPANAIGAVDFLNERRGREYVLAMAAALQVALPRPGRGHPRNALGGIRGALGIWEARLPRKMSNEEVAELELDE